LKESGNVTPVKRAIAQTDNKKEAENKRPKLTTLSSLNASNIATTSSQSGGFKITPFTDEQGNWFEPALEHRSFITYLPPRAIKLPDYCFSVNQNQVCFE
jgi:hypothetical protein